MFYRQLIVMLFVPFAFLSGMQHPLDTHILGEPQNLRILCGLADHLCRTLDTQFKYKKQVVVGVGQTPAYLIEVMRNRDEQALAKGEFIADRTYKKAAFSGYFFRFIRESIEDTESQYKLVLDDRLQDTLEQRECFYTEYLQCLDLSVEDIQADDAVYVFIDFCETGKGFRSFMHMMRNHNPQKVCYLYLAGENNKYAPFDFNLSNKVIPCKLSQELNDLVCALGCFEEYNDRLVAPFALSSWGTVDPLAFSLAPEAFQLLALLNRTSLGTIAL